MEKSSLPGVQILSVVPGRNRPDAGKMRIAPTGVPHAWALVPRISYPKPEKGGNGIISAAARRARFEGRILNPVCGYENWKSFTALGPMVLLNLAAMIRPGWFHDSSITPSRVASPTETIRRRSDLPGIICIFEHQCKGFFVRLMSPRAFSFAPRRRDVLRRRPVQVRARSRSIRKSRDGYWVKATVRRHPVGPPGWCWCSGRPQNQKCPLAAAGSCRPPAG